MCVCVCIYMIYTHIFLFANVYVIHIFKHMYHQDSLSRFIIVRIKLQMRFLNNSHLKHQIPKTHTQIYHNSNH